MKCAKLIFRHFLRWSANSSPWSNLSFLSLSQNTRHVGVFALNFVHVYFAPFDPFSAFCTWASHGHAAISSFDRHIPASFFLGNFFSLLHGPILSSFFSLSLWTPSPFSSQKNRIVNWLLNSWRHSVAPLLPNFAIPLTPFFRAGPLLYHKFENMVIFSSENLYSLCSPGNQHYPKIIQF